jgi:hypothetical protein
MPTQNNQDQTLSNNLDTPPVPPEQLQENQPPTNQTPPVPQGRIYTEEDMKTVHELYGQTLRENETRLQTLQAQLNQALPQQNNQQQQQPASMDDLLSNPSNVIGAEIEKRLQPITGFIASLQQNNLYTQLKDTFKRHPQFASFFTIPNAENLLDQQVAQMPAGTLNTNSLAGMITQIFGYMSFNGMVPQQQVVNNPQQPINQFNQQQQQQPINNIQQPNNMNNVPPHLRPSAPPMPNGMQGPNTTPKGNPRRPLTELEKRVARENNMSADDYIDWITVDSTQVVRSDVGKPQGGQ